MAANASTGQPKGKHLELPTPSGVARPRLTTTQSHLLPSTALFPGPNSRNASRTSLNRARDDREHKTPQASRYGLPLSKKEDEFRADAVWVEMQKTLADVELSAMNSSHVFSMTHAKALEDLRSAQLGLALAWAKSEADAGVDEEFGRDEQGVSAVGQMKGGPFTPASPTDHAPQASTASNASTRGDLEQETERDIMLARRRREANDQYFRQVNKGVLDVVNRLDDVVTAMRRVEKESRDIWNSSEASGSEDLGDVTETDESIAHNWGRKRGDTLESQATMGTESELLTDSPRESRRGG